MEVWAQCMFRLATRIWACVPFSVSAPGTGEPRRLFGEHQRVERPIRPSSSARPPLATICPIREC